ncbi:MAG: polyprenyl synthetase family protein [Bacteroidales bacterium]|nr:polyprenyl synthetase family protein [Bacteroidales bacterium]
MQYSSTELLTMVNEYIDSLNISRPPVGLYAPIEYVLSMGGKRLRPVLALMAYNLYKDNIKDVLPTVTGIEIYHNYTLLHDDLMDRADCRRGKQTVHKKWNDNTAILSGDAMLILAYQCVATCPQEKLPEVLDLFSRTALEICEGQQYDVDFEIRNDVTEAEYMEMIRLKTSVLLACALKIGAILADAPQEEAEKLYEFGINMGLAFQLEDDLLDVYGDPKVFGKNIGGDILCNKKTYMLIKALELADSEQREQFDYWLNATSFVPEKKIRAVTVLYDAISIKELCLAQIRHYTAMALQSLQALNFPAEKTQGISSLVKRLMERES